MHAASSSSVMMASLPSDRQSKLSCPPTYLSRNAQDALRSKNTRSFAKEVPTRRRHRGRRRRTRLGWRPSRRRLAWHGPVRGSRLPRKRSGFQLLTAHSGRAAATAREASGAGLNRPYSHRDFKERGVVR